MGEMMGNQSAVLDGKLQVPLTSRTNINWFRKYGPEQERLVRRLEPKEDETLGQLKEAYVAYKHDTGIEDISKALDLVKDIPYSSIDVTNFSFAVIEFQDEHKDLYWNKPGFFLSALINNCKEKHFTIVTRHLNREINCLGIWNTREIVVKGNVGLYVGWQMRGGKLIVDGDAGISVGRGMTGGVVIIEGNALNCVGEYMKGGEIHLNGDYRLNYQIDGGDIYHKEKLIVKDGKRLCEQP